jgi:hypothetical protein
VVLIFTVLGWGYPRIPGERAFLEYLDEPAGETAMHGLSAASVVNQMTEELAARRQAMSGRRAAYLALAKVILLSDEQLERLVPPSVQRMPRGDWESAAAA